MHTEHDTSPLVFFVSPDGHDGRTGTTPEPHPTANDGPLATPLRARNRAREARAEGYAGPIEIRLRGGVYRLEEPLTLGVEDGGVGPEGPVTWSAFENEEPVFDGGTTMSDWSRPERLPAGCPDAAADKLLSADVPKGLCFSRLYYDGEALPRAVSAESEEWRSWPICELGDDPATEVVIPPSEIPEDDPLDSAILNYMPTPYTRWSNALAPVVSVDRAAATICHGEFPPHRPEKTRQIPFRLENVASGLTGPGRWFLDSAAGRLFIIPPEGADADALEVVVPGPTELLVIEGSSDREKPVSHLTVRGISFRHTRLPGGSSGFDGPGAAVRIDEATDCLIESCRFERLGSSAIRAGASVVRTTLRNCVVSDIAGGGIIVRGKVGVPPFACHDNTIESCTITRIGRLYWHSSGISVGSAKATIIRDNLVHDVPYVGIAVHGGPRHTVFHGWPRRVPELEELWRRHGEGEPTIDGAKRFIPGHNLVEANTVHHVMQVLDDGAAIYCHAGHHSTVRGNTVYAVQSPMGMGLYFDDEEMDSTMEGNLVYRCPEDESLEVHSAVVHLHHNGRHRLERNILVGGKQVLSVPNGYGGHHIERNIFVFAAEPNWDRADPTPVAGPGDGRRQAGWDAGPSVVRHNLWWSPRGAAFAESLLAKWRSRGYGQDSFVADPRFVAPESGDYRLTGDSPAAALGFETT